MFVPLIVHERALGVLTLITSSSGRRYDITDLRHAEELARQAALAIANAPLYRDAEAARFGAEKANRAKDKFLAVLSPELRTPLTAMLAWGRMLRSGQLDPSQVGRAMAASERSTKLQTPAHQRSTGRVAHRRRQASARPVSGRVRGHHRRRARFAAPRRLGKKLRLDASLESGVAPVWGDPVRLNQIVVNLVSNAIKFTPQGRSIDVRLKQVWTRARLLVKDTGVGIESDVLPYIFDRFRQADSSHRHGRGGLGLGLAIVRQLVELHAGTVRASSEWRDHGATFVIKLPVMAGLPVRAMVESGLTTQLTEAPMRPGWSTRCSRSTTTRPLACKRCSNDVVRAFPARPGRMKHCRW